MAPAAATADAAAPPKKTEGGVFRATAARGRREGARSTPVAISGSTLSLDASSTPIRSLSSANMRRLDAVVKVKPAFSRRVSRPSCAVYNLIRWSAISFDVQHGLLR